MSLRTKIPLVLVFLAIVFYLNQETSVTGGENSSKTPAEPPHDIDKLLSESARDLARIHAHIEEWGTLNISQPLLMYDCGNFSLDSISDPWPSAPQYVAKAQTETNGGIAELAQKVLAMRLMAQLAPAGTSITTSATNAAALPGGTNAPDTNFSTNYLGLLGSTTNETIPMSTALTLGISDKLKEMALRMMAAPDHRLIAPKVKLYVALVQVSVNPGKRTQQHYIADIGGNFEYEYDGPNGEWKPSRNANSTQPTILDVMPLLDAQSLDLKNSQQDAFSLLATLLGTLPSSAVNGQLGAVMSYMEKHQRDSATKTAVPVINSYTSNIGFGFRIAPSYEAIANPDDPDSSSGNILAPTTFPAIVFLFIDPNDLKFVTKNQQSAAAAVDADSKKMAPAGSTTASTGTSTATGTLAYNNIVTHITGHWYRRDDTWWFPRKEEDMEETLEQDRLIGNVDDDLTQLYNDFINRKLNREQAMEFVQVRRDRYQFEPSDIGISESSPLPEDLLTDTSSTNTTPVVEDIEPNYIDPAKGGYFVITGKNLGNSTNSQVIVGNSLAISAQEVDKAFQYEKTNQVTATAAASAASAGTSATNALTYANMAYQASTNAIAAATAAHATTGTVPSPVAAPPTAPAAPKDSGAGVSTNSNFPVYVPGIPPDDATNAYTKFATNCLVIYVPKSPAGFPMPVSKTESPEIPVTVVTQNGVARSALHLVPIVPTTSSSTNADNPKPPSTNATSASPPVAAAAIATSGEGFYITTSSTNAAPSTNAAAATPTPTGK